MHHWSLKGHKWLNDGSFANSIFFCILSVFFEEVDILFLGCWIIRPTAVVMQQCFHSCFIHQGYRKIMLSFEVREPSQLSLYYWNHYDDQETTVVLMKRNQPWMWNREQTAFWSVQLFPFGRPHPSTRSSNPRYQRSVWNNAEQL